MSVPTPTGQQPANEREPYPMWVDGTFKTATHALLAVAQVPTTVTYSDPREWVVLADAGEGEYQRYVTWRVSWNMGRYNEKGEWLPGFWNAYWGHYFTDPGRARDDFAERAGFLAGPKAEIDRLTKQVTALGNELERVLSDWDSEYSTGPSDVTSYTDWAQKFLAGQGLKS